MRRAAMGLARILDPPAVLATSPYARAAQTAVILAETFGGPDPEHLDLLTPEGEWKDLAAWLRERGDQRVAMVGHEPHLSGFACWLLGARGGALELKKGAACLLDVAPGAEPGAAMLRWALTPSQLRQLGK